MKRRVALLLFVLILGVSPMVFAADELSFAGLQWTSVIDTWQVTSSGLVNSAMDSTNTNVYAPLEQKGDILTYEYAFDFLSSTSPTSGPMAGMQFLCDDPTSASRGNSLLIWQDQNYLRIYQTVPGSNGKRYDFPLTVGLGESHAYRVVIKPKSDEVTVYRDGNLILTYKTPAPIVTGGGYVSVRTNSTIAVLKSFSFNGQ